MEASDFFALFSLPEPRLRLETKGHSYSSPLPHARGSIIPSLQHCHSTFLASQSFRHLCLWTGSMLSLKDPCA